MCVYIYIYIYIHIYIYISYIYIYTQTGAHNPGANLTRSTVEDFFNLVGVPASSRDAPAMDATWRYLEALHTSMGKSRIDSYTSTKMSDISAMQASVSKAPHTHAHPLTQGAQKDSYTSLPAEILAAAIDATCIDGTVNALTHNPREYATWVHPKRGMMLIKVKIAEMIATISRRVAQKWRSVRDAFSVIAHNAVIRRAELRGLLAGISYHVSPPDLEELWQAFCGQSSHEFDSAVRQKTTLSVPDTISWDVVRRIFQVHHVHTRMCTYTHQCIHACICIRICIHGGFR